MKRLIGILAAAAMLACAPMTAGAAESGQILEIPDVGITMELPMNLEELKGHFEGIDMGEISPGMGIYYYGSTYYALTKEEVMELSSREMTEEEMEYVSGRVFYGVDLFSFKEDMSFEDLNAILGTDFDPANARELGKADGYVFYSHYDPELSDASDVEPEYVEEFQELVDAFLEGSGLTLAAPLEKGAGLVGKMIQFETEDLDGNPVKSEDLFAEHEITMLNIWGTWCPPCKGELGELAKINEKIQKLDCAVVGLLEDGNKEEGRAAASSLFEENGTNYVNLMPYEGFQEDLQISAFPTTFYVDRDGVILAPPLIGAYVDAYEPMIYSLLEEKGIEVPEAAEEEAAGEPAEEEAAGEPAEEEAVQEEAAGPVANEEGVYRVVVTDESGAPVEGAMVQFCSDTSCIMGKTDGQGTAVFEQPEGTYTVHILKAPEGFAGDDTEYVTLETFCDIPITLKAQ